MWKLKFKFSFQTTLTYLMVTLLFKSIVMCSTVQKFAVNYNNNEAWHQFWQVTLVKLASADSQPIHV